MKIPLTNESLTFNSQRKDKNKIILKTDIYEVALLFRNCTCEPHKITKRKYF